jgi:dTMP kinase
MTKRIQPGFFITVEGPEGAGKTTQIKLLAEHLGRRGFSCRVTREPGGTELGEELRKLLKHHRGRGAMLPLTELLLIAAARAQHVGEVIKPELEAGNVVICDRFFDSTAAYQGAGRGMPDALIATLRDIAAGDCAPDLTLLLDLAPERGFERNGRRAETAGSFDRFEAEPLPFHTRIRAGFLAIAQAEPDRVKIIDADADTETVRRKIQRMVDETL